MSTVKCPRCHGIPLVISFISITAGILVIIGWIFNIVFLKSILPFWVPMRFVTAICFIMSGLTLFSVHRIIHSNAISADFAPIVLSSASLSIIILMSVILASIFFKISIGIEELFTNPLMVESASNQVSMATVFNFLIIAVVGILAMFKPKNFKQLMFCFGIIIGFVGLIGIIGYIFNIPFLYFDISGISSPIAFNTTTLFLLMGFGFFMLSLEKIAAKPADSYSDKLSAL